MKTKFKKFYKSYEMLSAIFKSFDKFVIISITSTSVSLSVTGIGLIFVPISTGIACGMTISN